MLEGYNNVIPVLRQKLGSTAQNIVIIPHMSPDGDAAGSSTALFQAMSKKGLNANIVMCDKFPNYLKWLEGVGNAISLHDKKEEAIDLLHNADMIFMLDHNTPKREGELEIYNRDFKGEIVMIDHHPMPEDVDYRLSYVAASSTCEIIYEFLTGMWGRDIIDADIANSIYTGLNTDTGGFKHNSSNPRLYEILADLLSLGLDKNKVDDLIYNVSSTERLRLIGHLLKNKLHVYEDYPLAVTIVNKDDLERYNYVEGDLEGFVNMPLSIKRVLVSIQLVEVDNVIRMSFRSKYSIPVNIWASQHFNGGGHRNAAGGRISVSLDEVVDKIENTKEWFFDAVCIKAKK